MLYSTDTSILIRQEIAHDESNVFALVKEAFLTERHSDHKEQYLVDRLRGSSHFIPELSLVALLNDTVIGYILLTLAGIKNKSQINTTLALAPVVVHPSYQMRGIGSSLINYAHKKAIEMDYESIVLVGHQDYYPKFGYELAKKFDIKFPFDVPEINSFVLELKKDALKEISGEVVYAKEFFEG